MRVGVDPGDVPADRARRRALRRRRRARDPAAGARVQPARRGPHLRGRGVDAGRGADGTTPGDRGLFEIARRVTADIAPDETLRKEIDPPRGWGRRVTVIVPEVDVHDALTDRSRADRRVDRLRLHARGRRAARPRRGAERAQRRDRRGRRMRIRERRGSGRPAARSTGGAAGSSGHAEDVETEHARLAELVDRRREARARRCRPATATSTPHCPRAQCGTRPEEPEC